MVQEMSAPQEVPAAELLHQTIAERMEDTKQESDVVARNILQAELVDSKVEHEDTILSEEIKRNTEIEQPTIEVEKQAPEESVIVKAEVKLEETIIVEIPEVEVIAETEEPEEVEVIAEAEELEEVEVIAETEEPEEVEVIAETEEPEEVEVIAETEELEEVEVIAETEEPEEVEVIAETEELEEVEVIAETEELEEVEVIAETEEPEEVEVIAEAEELEEVEPVALEETQQEMLLNEAIEQKNEFIHGAEADEQTKKDVQSFANVLIAEEQQVVEEAPIVEEQQVVEEAPIVEEQQVVEEAPIAEEQQVVEEAPIVEEQQVVEEAPIVEEQQVVEEAPIVEEQQVVEEAPIVEEQQVVEEAPIVEEQQVVEEAPIVEEQQVVEEAPIVEEQQVVEEAPIVEEQQVVEEAPIVEEQQVVEEAPIVEEQQVVEEAPIVEEQQVVEEAPIVEEQQVVEEAPIVEEQQVVEEAPIVEEQQVVEEAPIAEEQQVVEEAPIVEEQQVVEKAPIVEEQQVVEEAPIAEEQQVVEEAPIVEEQQVVEEAPIAEEQQVVEEAPIAEEQQVVEEAPIVEEQQVVEKAPIVEEQQVVEKAPIVEEQQVVQKEEPKREKKRHVPFNVVMLKQDRTRLRERHAARMNAMQSSMSERVENKPVHQVEEQQMQQEVIESRVEEKPVQQVVVESRVEEKPVQQVVVEPQVEEKPVQQVVVEPQVEEKPMQQVVVESRVEEKPMQQVVVEPQVEEKPMQQVVVESQVEEKPVQQVVVESRVEERPMQQVVVEPQVEEKPVQQVVVEQVQKPISSTEVQEKAYVVNQRENDMRNVLQTPPTYTIPPLTLLSIPQQAALDNTEWLDEQKELLDTTFNNFHVGAHVINVSQGPAVTRFEVQPDPGVKVNKITNLSDDIKLSLAAKDIRIEAPIPGKSAIGIEVPNKESKPVFLREILRSPVFTKSESPLTVALGLDISGDPIVTDIRKMPHGLIAGATGSGKSVCINAILTSILYKAKPHEVKLMLIDPKMVELAPYNSVPHLVAPVITDVKAATAALKWAVEEMERRYELFAHAGARDLTRYNTIVSGREIPGETLPYIVIVIDELADLMMVAPGDVEEAICRIAQKARACGIHLLVATQRPSVDVITGLIKSNIPTRIAFTVSSQVDSRTIIDIGGAEKLLGRGDMLFLGNGTSKPVRVQGVYVSDDEIEKTVDHVRKQMKPNYLFKQEDLLAKTEQAESEDELFFDACQFVVEQGGASTSSVQRKFRIGYNRAARLIEEMESQGIISEGRGTKPRDVLISEDEFAAMQETNV
ncbi:DNA translocase FtsK [Bacillus cereus]